MKQYTPTIRQALVACLLLAPLFQLIGDSLWISHRYNYAWSLWREASYIFFVPVGFLLAKLLEPKSPKWAVLTCALYVIGCFGSATMMPLFRLGAFYPIIGHNEFPAVVQSVLGKNGFGFTLFLPGLCFPISLLAFGLGFLKHKVLPATLSLAFLAAGIFFFLGNAIEIDPVLIAGDAWLFFLFCSLVYFLFIRKSDASPAQGSKSANFFLRQQAAE